jgi:hypothetical protein
MTNKIISDLTAFALPKDGAEKFEIEAGGVSKQMNSHQLTFQYAFPSVMQSNDVGSFATLGNYFNLIENIIVDALIGSWNNSTIGNIYSMFIGTLDSSGNLTGTTVTATSRFTTLATGIQSHKFACAQTVLVAGTRYYLGLVRTNGTSTSACQATGSSLAGYPNLPVDIGKMENESFGGAGFGCRAWFAQNSDAPGAVTKSGSNNGMYGLGLRFSLIN